MTEHRIAPDIFWIVTDEHRCDGIGAYGNPWIKTPNLDRLANEGMLFERAYCQAAACVPSRASFLSGLYPHKVDNLWYDPTPDQVRFFPEYLREDGYHTLNLGKEGHMRSTSAFEYSDLTRPDPARGFRSEGNPLYLGPEFKGQEDAFDILTCYSVPAKPLIIGGTNPLRSEEAEAAILVNEAIRYLKNYNGDQPLLQRVSVISPHTPVLPPQPYDKMYDPADTVFPTDGRPSFNRSKLDTSLFKPYAHTEGMRYEDLLRSRAAYYGLCSYVDAELGRYLDYIREHWQRPYLILFHSDHGNLLGEHERREKFNIYEASRRVPLIIAGSGIPQGQRMSHLVELIDIAPTILDFCGLTVTPEMGLQGQSLLPLIRGEDVPWRDAVFNEIAPGHVDDYDRFPELRQFVFTEIDGKLGHEYAALESRFDPFDINTIRRLERAPKGARLRMWRPIVKCIRTERYALTVRAIWREGQGDDYMGSLFDLEKDPYEFNNRFADSAYDRVRTALIDKLKNWDLETI